MAAWLEMVGAGLGVYAHILEQYGVAEVADIQNCEEDDFTDIASDFKNAEEAPLPLKIKMIIRALRKEADAQKAANAKQAAARGPPGSASAAGGGNPRSEESDEEEEEEAAADDDDDFFPEDEPNEPASARASAASASTTRPRSFQGKARAKESAAAAANGKASIPSLFGRSESKKNRHGVGGQASAAAAAAGRARPFGGLAARTKGQMCVNPCGQLLNACSCAAEAQWPDRCTGPFECAVKLKALTEGALAFAQRTPSEVVMRSGTASEHNLARLKLYLLRHAFDPVGTPLVHLVCLQACFKVSSHFTIDLHASVVKLAGAKTETLPKSRVVSLGLTDEDIVRPAGSLGSVKEYLATLKDDDSVDVLAQTGRHALCGKPSNNAKLKERALFRTFIQEHRSPTGRTQDSSGRYHGAEFYLMSRLTQVKTQPGRDTKDEDAVLECVFKKALQGRADPLTGRPDSSLKPPSGTAVSGWFAEYFGIGCEFGHTTLFPHKSDACALCESWDVDINSTDMSIKRHSQQTGDMTLERQVSFVPAILDRPFLPAYFPTSSFLPPSPPPPSLSPPSPLPPSFYRLRSRS